MAQSPPIRPSIALAALAERFIEGRRVLVFGNALSAFWEQLIERGARLVHVCDTDATRVAEAAARNTSQNVSFAPLHGAGLAVRDGAFDVGFIDNLAAFADPQVQVHKLRRALSPRGVAIVSAPNPDLEQPLVGAALECAQKVDYYSLYDLVHRDFPVVRMVGQMPFVGYSVAELAPASDPEPCLDAGFVPGGTEEPEWFVAVGSHIDVDFDPFLVVQLPCETLLKNGTERLLREQLRAARTTERSAVERLSRLEAEHRKVVESAERHQRDVDLARQIRLLQEELERKESWILQLEARAATADARADEADQELEEFRTQLGIAHDHGDSRVLSQPLPNVAALEAEVLSLRSRFESEEQRRKTLEQKLDRTKPELTALQAALAAANTELAQADARFALTETARKTAESERDVARSAGAAVEEKLVVLEHQLKSVDPEIEKELQQLEAQLVERGNRIRTLEADLAKTERFGKQLLRELERLRISAHTLSTPLATIDAVTETPATEAQEATMVTHDAWTQGNAMAQEATTAQSAAQVSTWTEASAPPASPELDELRSKLDHLAALAAQQQADLGESRWQIEQISAENLELRETRTQNETLNLELTSLRARLQETEVLLAQQR